MRILRPFLMGGATEKVKNTDGILFCEKIIFFSESSINFIDKGKEKVYNIDICIFINI